MPDGDQRTVSRAALRTRKLAYGFKAEAKRQALRIRHEAGVRSVEPIDCFRLATEMGITIVRLSALPRTQHTQHLAEVEPNAMSAATVRSHGRVGIWLNDSHPPHRQQSNLAHEIGHVVLAHDDCPPLTDAGCRELDADIEAEADYLGSVLLIPDPAAVAIVRQATPIAAAAAAFGVSEQMMRWRINDSGAMIRASREHTRKLEYGRLP